MTATDEIVRVPIIKDGKLSFENIKAIVRRFKASLKAPEGAADGEEPADVDRNEWQKVFTAA